MAEYISREDAVDELQVKVFHNLTDEYYGTMQVLNELPAADVVPVVHAHWYILEYESLTCSRCGGSYYTGCDSTTEAKERLKEGIYPKYCPNCGAKMDGGENHE